jgi:hypothetical protein
VTIESGTPLREELRGRDVLEGAGLIDTMVKRRSRRFALGSNLDGGPLSYRSAHDAVPLSVDEEAVIAFAGAGTTGYVYAELPYESGEVTDSGGGNVMVTMLGRTIPSADAVHAARLFVLNDEGTFLMRAPQDFPAGTAPELAKLAQERRFTELYERSRVKVRDERVNPERVMPYVLPFNKWSANIPGATYFLPVSELTALYLTVLFAIYSEEFGYFVFDERNGFKPAGLKRFARSKGGHLYDDPNDGRVGTILDAESYVLELAAVEHGLMVQNMMLATEALGLGGFPHYGGHRFGWFEPLGFRMQRTPLAKLMRLGPLTTRVLNYRKQNVDIPGPVGLEVDGQTLLKPFCPPYYPSMEAAVRAFVDFKYAQGTGTFRSGQNAWSDSDAVQAGIPEYTEANVEAVIAYCEYVWGRYGRFLAHWGPFKTVIAYQAHHVDTAFYDRFYTQGSYTDAHREHMARWHGGS